MEIQINSSPFSLDQVVGQPFALKYLKSFIQHPNKIPSLLIFHGPSGVGKFFTAERFIATILCHKGNGCGVCPSCKLFLKLSHPDYIAFPEGVNVPIGEEGNPSEYTIRWLQSKRVIYSPSLSSYRFVLFPDASRILPEAETAMLKTLEDAPSHTKFIFIVENPKFLKETILSRGVLIPFQYLSRDAIIQISKKQNIYIHEFQDGTMDLNFIEPELWSEYLEMVQNSYLDSILLLKFEQWIYEQKNQISKWKIDFDFIRFLDIISGLLIYAYYKEKPKGYEECIDALFEFKNMLHKEIPKMENFLISKLIFQLTSIIH